MNEFGNEHWCPALVALGSNLGDRRALLDAALDDLRATGGIAVRGVSSWIETEAWGGPEDAPAFLNGAAAFETCLGPRALLARLHEIEARHGRTRGPEDVRNAPRTLDLDLLLFGSKTIDEEGLRVPHPGLEERLFVLVPLAEIAPRLVLPKSGQTVLERVAFLQARATADPVGDPVGEASR